MLIDWMAANSASLAALGEAFPGFTTEQLAAALDRHRGNVDAAAAALLLKQVCPMDWSASCCCCRRSCGHEHAAQTPFLYQLASRTCLILQSGEVHAKSSGFRGRRNTSWGTLAEASGQRQGRPPVAARFTSRQGSEQGPLLGPADFPAGIGGAATQQAGDVRTQPPAAQLHPGPRSRRWQQAPLLLPALPPSLASASSAAEQRLLEEHAWAGRELVAAVLAAMQGDAAAAAAALADMVAEGGSSAGHCSSAPASASRAGRPPAADSWAQGAAHEEEEGEEDSAEEQHDPYFKHRRRALRLSRRWGRAARGAGAAYAAGEHSAARQLAAEAQRLRREALAAHAEAAARIEEENNRDNRLAGPAGQGSHTPAPALPEHLSGACLPRTGFRMLAPACLADASFLGGHSPMTAP